MDADVENDIKWIRNWYYWKRIGVNLFGVKETTLPLRMEVISRMRLQHERELKDLEDELSKTSTELLEKKLELMQLQMKYDSCIKENRLLKSELQTMKNAKSVKVEEGKIPAASGAEAEWFIPNAKLVDEPRDRERLTNLHRLAMEGREWEVMSSLAAGADTRAQDARGMTPLHLALFYEREDVAELIAEADAGNDLRDECGRTPLHLAAGEGYVIVMRKLLCAGADVRCRGEKGRTPLHYAVLFGGEDAAEFLSGVDAGNDLRDDSRCTPLHLAAMRGYAGVIGKLLSAGADVRCRSVSGWAPLHYALHFGRGAAAELLLDADTDSSFRDDDGRTPLHWVTMVPSQGAVLGVLMKLLHAGANTRCRSASGRTPLHCALYFKNKIVAEVISGADGENDFQDREGRTPLYYATDKGYVGVVRNLLFSGAHPHLMDNGGKSAFEKSLEAFGRLDIIQIFISMIALRNVEVDWLKGTRRPETVQCCVELAAECDVEVQKMKETKVRGSCISYFDVASKHASRVAAYLGNDEVRRVLLEGSAARSFPHYSELIAFRVQKADRWRILIDRCFHCFDELSRQLPCLTQVTFELILRNLTEYELQNFVKALIPEP